MFAFAKRIVLFLALNLLVVITISFITQALGLGSYLTARGLDYQALAVFCLLWGMVGSLISLALSRIMAKMMMGVQIIDGSARDPELQELVQTVHRLARAAGLPAVPQVGIYDSPEPNAFATGPTKARSLVAVSTGLLNRMNRSQVEGVLSHEIAHIQNGDMVTMTLLQGVVNAFVMFMARALAFAISQATSKRDDDRGGSFNPLVYHITVFVLEIVFMILGSIVVAAFSRWREFRADRGGAVLGGRENMIEALRALQKMVELRDPAHDAPALQAFKISGKRRGSFLALFSSHPPLEDRIARLETLTGL